MTEQMKQSLPAVWKIIQEAEKLINELTGARVKVTVNVTEKHKYHQRLIDVLTDYFNITALELKGKSRKRELATARQIFIYMAYIPGMKGCMSEDLGRLLNRDHSTILHSLSKIKDLIQVKDEYICISITNIQKKLSENETH